MRFVFTLSFIFLLLSGCAKQTFIVNEQSLRLASDEMQMFFVAGIGQSQSINAAQVCGGAEKVAAVETEMTFLNGLINSFSSGIVSPRQARVYCSN